MTEQNLNLFEDLPCERRRFNKYQWDIEEFIEQKERKAKINLPTDDENYDKL